MKILDAKKELIELKSRLLYLEKFIKEPEDLFNKVKNYDDVCKELNEPRESCPYKKIKQIEKLFNGSWIKNWLDKNQQKWYPYFEFTGSDLVFYRSFCYHCSSDGQVAYYKDKKTSDFVGKTFLKEYQDII
jgi:hypothetical protein